MAALEKGITRNGEGFSGKTWNILGQVYFPKAVCDSTFAFETNSEPGQFVPPYHFKHFDELLADMGAAIRRRSPLVEKFTPPDADAYARFLASAPDYKVEAA
jgi:hypothetical protein